MKYELKDSEKRGLQGLLSALLLSQKKVDSFTQYKRVDAIATNEEIALLNKLHGILERNEEVTLNFRY